MKVLLSAYACNPEAGSEPGVGFETLVAMARHHDVWVLTRAKNARVLSAYPFDQESKDRIHVVPIELGPVMLRLKKSLGGLGLQIYYERWQVWAAREGRRLHENVGFDVAHHVTFSADWSRAGVSEVPVPFVWGPIGGGVTAPIGLMAIFGFRGVIAELARELSRRTLRLRAWYRRAWRTSKVILVQNRETSDLRIPGGEVWLLPNSTAVHLAPQSTGESRTKEILVIGRLIPWKGPMLALAAFRRVRDPAAVLTFLGQGPELGRLQRAVQRWGLGGRVTFAGSIPRHEVVARVSRAGVVVHAAMHEENSMAVGEALALGTPVVCLDRGGPAELLRQWEASPGVAVPVSTPRQTAARLARAVDQFLRNPPEIPREPLHPKTSYSDVLLRSYDVARGSVSQEQPG